MKKIGYWVLIQTGISFRTFFSTFGPRELFLFEKKKKEQHAGFEPTLPGIAIPCLDL
jgi:hypothetical protein